MEQREEHIGIELAIISGIEEENIKSYSDHSSNSAVYIAGLIPLPSDPVD